MVATPDSIRFSAFVDDALKIQQSLDRSSAVFAFQEFCAAASRLIAAQLPEIVESITPLMDSIAEWLLPEEFDLLAIGRATHDEDAYTNLLAWWLDPAVESATCLQRQRAFLELTGVAAEYEPTVPTRPLVRFHTDDGIPDLVLAYPNVVVVVEAKTWTSEHEAPSGALQTEAYPPAVRRRLHLSEDSPVICVFLTIDGSRPEASDAVPLRFFDCALGITERFRPSDFAAGFSQVVQVWLTHLFLHAPPPGTDVDVVSLLKGVKRLQQGDGEFALSFWLGHLNTIGALREHVMRISNG